MLHRPVNFEISAVACTSQQANLKKQWSMKYYKQLNGKAIIFTFIWKTTLIESFISLCRSTSSSCLKTWSEPAKPAKNLISKENMRLPAEVFDANVQYQLKFGPKSKHSLVQNGGDICKDLHCTKDHYTWASHAALEGTTCGSKKVWTFRDWCKKIRQVKNIVLVQFFPFHCKTRTKWLLISWLFNMVCWVFEFLTRLSKIRDSFA